MEQLETVCVVGLGYVGLPLAVAFGKQRPTVGFDIDETRISELREGRDRTLEVEPEELGEARHLSFAGKPEEIGKASVYILTVPTPVDHNKRPDLGPLLSASRTVGRLLKKGDLVIYESTVFPTCTETRCVPVLEAESGLKYNEDFFCGYSPERINPGDKQHRIAQIVKVTSGSTPEIAERVDALYRSIITAGTFKAASIQVAEAAKVIENCQRDLNIAFVNELALLFDRLALDTTEVLQAASTKWNFLRFTPGLVGGHCIGVDPYYLTYKAEEVGYHPEVILAGRRINDNMGRFVAGKVVKLMIKAGFRIGTSRALVMGITFKENCPDIRNSRVIDIVEELQEYNVAVDVYDPWADADEVRKEYGVELFRELPERRYEAIVLAVSHQAFKELDLNLTKAQGAAVFDVKSFLAKEEVSARL